MGFMPGETKDTREHPIESITECSHIISGIWQKTGWAVLARIVSLGRLGFLGDLGFSLVDQCNPRTG
jgi:hypothetical protein